VLTGVDNVQPVVVLRDSAGEPTTRRRCCGEGEMGSKDKTAAAVDWHPSRDGPGPSERASRPVSWKRSTGTAPTGSATGR